MPADRCTRSAAHWHLIDRPCCDAGRSPGSAHFVSGCPLEGVSPGLTCSSKCSCQSVTTLQGLAFLSLDRRRYLLSDRELLLGVLKRLSRAISCVVIKTSWLRWCDDEHSFSSNPNSRCVSRFLTETARDYRVCHS